jgi:hypothetical protein
MDLAEWVTVQDGVPFLVAHRDAGKVLIKVAALLMS